MNKVIKWLLLIAWALVLFFTRETLRDTLGFHLTDISHPTSGKLPAKATTPDTGSIACNSSPTNFDSLYIWDDDRLDWVAIGLYLEARKTAGSPGQVIHAKNSAETPVKIDWKVLSDIKYRLKYFPAFEMSIYAPVFSKTVKALDGKTVDIEGFVIPFEEDDKQMALSANPYASCFFCGQAGPASIISVRLLKSGKRFKLDAFQSFRGRLRLNHDDPNEFYYILEEAWPLP